MPSYRRMKFDPIDIKVIILYILYRAEIPLSAAEITDTILADSLLDFFEAHMYITMLIKDGQIEHIEGIDKYTTTAIGKEAAELFYKGIPYSIRSKIEQNLKSLQNDELMRELVFADYEAINETDYIVHLKLTENRFVNPVIDLKIRVSDRQQANELCKKWRTDYASLYGKISEALI